MGGPLGRAHRIRSQNVPVLVRVRVLGSMLVLQCLKALYSDLDKYTYGDVGKYTYGDLLSILVRP